LHFRVSSLVEQTGQWIMASSSALGDTDTVGAAGGVAGAGVHNGMSCGCGTDSALL
jgi:hypothetical protein